MSGPRYTTDGMWFRPFYSHPTKKATFRAALVLTISPRAGLSLEALVRGPHITLHGWPLPFPCGFFIFLFFNFVFYKNIFSFSKFTEIYPGRPAAGRSAPSRPAAGRQGLFCKSFRGKFARGPLEPGARPLRPPGPSGRPAAGQQAPTARQRGDQLPQVIYKGWLVPPPLICITKIPETKKKERWREGEAKRLEVKACSFSSSAHMLSSICHNASNFRC